MSLVVETALAHGTAHFDGPGGSQVPEPGARAVAAALLERRAGLVGAVADFGDSAGDLRGACRGPLDIARDFLGGGALLLDGGGITAVRLKHDLPNYGVFDEKRVFVPGPMPGPIVLKGVRIGVPVCEDIWGPDVVECVAETGGETIARESAIWKRIAEAPIMRCTRPDSTARYMPPASSTVFMITAQ